MRRWCQPLSVVMALLLAGPSLAGTTNWVQFADETDTRLVADPAVGADDVEEKDYAWGDVDQDGDIDLVVVRKVIGSNSGSKRNVLFMNEGIAQGQAINGVLVDRTNDYATAADDGGQGFLDLTPDRDVALVDVNGDTWLDIVTAPSGAFTPGLPKTISHPRIYINLGNDAEGNWQGFMYEEARIPQLIQAPNFTGIGFGDVIGDGSPDLYFTDSYNNLEDRLLVNDGSGFFTDETELCLFTWLTTAIFSPHAVIADLNHDGYNDILKLAALGPYDMKIAYNDSNNVGIFTQANGEVIFTSTGYFVAVDDLNNDGKLDIVMAHHGPDRYFLNQGNGPDGKADWISFTFPDSETGFDNNTVIADLDNDGFKDVLIADVDVDLPSCQQRLDIHHNLGNPPNVMFEEDAGNLPTDAGGPLRGTHDVAVFDLNGDGRLDLVIGTCSGTTVWIQQVIGDLDGDGTVGVLDLLILLSSWGPCPDPPQGCPADLDADGAVGILDLLTLLAHWG